LVASRLAWDDVGSAVGTCQRRDEERPAGKTEERHDRSKDADHGRNRHDRQAIRDEHLSQEYGEGPEQDGGEHEPVPDQLEPDSSGREAAQNVVCSPAQDVGVVETSR